MSRPAPANTGQPLNERPAARAAVVGASGFAGALAADLLWNHPGIQLEKVTARREAGRRLDELFPHYRVPMTLESFEADECGGLDVAIVGLPHASAAESVVALRERDVRVVDLSADFRLSDRETYERWYGPNFPPQELVAQAVFGLTELRRDEVAGAGLVANPGCYSTAAILALAPLARAGLIADAVVDAKSGVSGAGREATLKTHFVSVDENVSAYAVEGHRHLPEVEQELSTLGFGGPITFVPHLLPLDQGLLASCYVKPTRSIDRDEVASIYEESYGSERFIELVEAPPGVRDVRDTNICRLQTDVVAERVVVFAAIDNLWKGAAGQAVQNMNVMLDLDETAGLL